MSFKPCYTWPNPAFPFRLYFDGPDLRIFIIENIFHNYNWLGKHARGIKDTDKFIVILGWHHGDWHAHHSRSCIEACGLNIENFLILCNDMADYMIFSDHGFSCHFVNQNCFLDYNLFDASMAETKIYKAVYIARLTPFKRHYLCDKLEDLALVCGDLHGGDEGEHLPPHIYINSKQLTPDEVKNVINQSHVGLILSDIEGACFASSEYLLCGIPVVSTKSHGGRSVWYNEYNSEICDSTPESVRKCVSSLISKSPSPERIRRHHVELSKYFRQNFIAMIQDLFDRHYVAMSATTFFEEHYFHKMRVSMTPNFDDLFKL
jgi:hypothetical protein